MNQVSGFAESSAMKRSTDRCNRRISLARQRNRKNLINLRQSFSMYTQLYGKEAARQALVRIAASEFHYTGIDNLVDVINSLDAAEQEPTITQNDSSTPSRYQTYKTKLGSVQAHQPSRGSRSYKSGQPTNSNGTLFETDPREIKSDCSMSPLSSLFNANPVDSHDSVNQDDKKHLDWISKMEHSLNNIESVEQPSSLLMHQSTQGNAVEVTNNPDLPWYSFATFPENDGLAATRNADVPCVYRNTTKDHNIAFPSTTNTSSPLMHSPERSSQDTTSNGMSIAPTTKLNELSAETIRENTHDKIQSSLSNVNAPDTDLKVTEHRKSAIDFFRTNDAFDNCFYRPMHWTSPTNYSVDAASQETSSTTMAAGPKKRKEIFETESATFSFGSTKIDDLLPLGTMSITQGEGLSNKANSSEEIVIRKRVQPFNAFAKAKSKSKTGARKQPEFSLPILPCVNTSNSEIAVSKRVEPSCQTKISRRNKPMTMQPFVVQPNCASPKPVESNTAKVTSSKCDAETPNGGVILPPFYAPGIIKSTSKVHQKSAMPSKQLNPSTTDANKRQSIRSSPSKSNDKQNSSNDANTTSSSEVSFFGETTATSSHAADATQSFYGDSTASFYPDSVAPKRISFQPIASSSSFSSPTINSYANRYCRRTKDRTKEKLIVDAVASAAVDKAVGIIYNMNKKRSKIREDDSRHDGILSSTVAPPPFSPSFLKGYMHYLHLKS